MNLPPLHATVSTDTARIYVAASCCSLSCCILVLLLHARSRRLSQFPSSIMLWRIVCDSLLCIQLIVLNTRLLLAGSEKGGFDACSPGLAFLAQFSLFGSLGWYACLALNLYLSVTRPFTRPSERMGLFHTWVWLGSAATGAVAAAQHGYRPLYQLCWIVDNSAAGHFTAANWALLGGWVVAYPFLSALALAYCEWVVRFDRDREHIASRLRPRLLQLRASRMATAVFSAFWAGLGGLYVYMFLRYEVIRSQGYEAAARQAFALTIGLLGTCDAAVWLVVQLAVNRTALAAAVRPRCCGGADESSLGSADKVRADDISDALRREFVRNTIVGIVTSTRTVNAEAISVHPARSRDGSGSESGMAHVHRATPGCCGDGCGLGGCDCCCGLCGLYGEFSSRTVSPVAAGASSSSSVLGQIDSLKQPLLRDGLSLNPPRPPAAAAADNDDEPRTPTAPAGPRAAETHSGRFGRYTTPSGNFYDRAIPHLAASHFSEVWTLQVPIVYL